MSVAAVIPCRNAAEFLGEALASVRAQTHPVDEVIVVDDRSTDGSAEVARAAGAVVLRAPPPGGPSAARNAGWRHSRADLIAFLDADDRWLPHHIATVVTLLDKYPEAVLAFGGIELFGIAQGRFATHLPPSDRPVDARVPAAMDCVAPQMAVIVRRSALEAVGGYDETLLCAQDFELFARLAKFGQFVSAEPVTAQYRQHATQITRHQRGQLYSEAVEVRHRNLNALRGELPASQIAVMEAHMRTAWDHCIRDQWRETDKAGVELLLARNSYVPDSDLLLRHWRSRVRYGWHASAAVKTLGRALRLRKLWNATFGGGAPGKAGARE